MNPSRTIIVGEIRDDARFGSYVSETGDLVADTGGVIQSGIYVGLGISGSGQSGYLESHFPSGNVPINLNESGFYEIKTTTVGLYSSLELESLLSNSFDYANPTKQYNVGAISLDGLYVPYTSDRDWETNLQLLS